MTFLYDCLRRVIGVERGSPNPLEDESNGAEVYDATASSGAEEATAVDGALSRDERG